MYILLYILLPILVLYSIFHQMWRFSPNVPNYSLYKMYNNCNIYYYINHIIIIIHQMWQFTKCDILMRGGVLFFIWKVFQKYFLLIVIKKRIHMRNLFYWPIFPSVLVQDQYCKKRTNKYQLLKLQCIIPKGIAEKRFYYDEKNTQSK